LKRPGAISQEKIDGFIKKCRKVGLKVTPQRTAIYRELAATNEHPTAESIYNRVRAYYPSVSLATIYRTLETFKGLGLISVANVLHEAARYDANLDHHHHLVCVVCKKVEDFYDDSLKNLRIPKKARDNYRIISYGLQFNGICRECQGKEN